MSFHFQISIIYQQVVPRVPSLLLSNWALFTYKSFHFFFPTPNFEYFEVLWFKHLRFRFFFYFLLSSFSIAPKQENCRVLSLLLANSKTQIFCALCLVFFLDFLFIFISPLSIFFFLFVVIQWILVVGSSS